MKHTWKTGAFAKMANITERTLRYYDKIGLLKPSMIQKNGYRCYDEDDFIKLQKILALKQLGFSIEEIFPLMNDHVSLQDSFQMQIDLLDKKIIHLQNLRELLKKSLLKIHDNHLDWNEVASIMQMIGDDDRLVDQYKNANNLKIRIRLHELYSTNQTGWFPWLFQQIDFTHVNRLIEIGCGDGSLWHKHKIDLRNREIFLTDISEGMIEEVRKNLGNDVNCMLADCEKLPFKNIYFDAAVANHVLFYLKDLNQGLREINRVLKPGGICYCSTYGKQHMKELSNLVYAFDRRIYLSKTHLYDIFGLENGKDILMKYFSKVTCQRYQDVLFVDHSQPIIDYIMSCHGNQNEILGPQIDTFKNFVEKYIQVNQGIEITKDAGLFICEK